MNTLAELRAGRLAGAQRLDLCCELAEFPREIFDLADSLEVLNLSGNALAALPDDLGRLHRLRVLFCSNNRFTHLPAAVGRCQALEMVGFKSNRVGTVPEEALPPLLRWLILTDNQIEELPDALGNCTRLQKLMLAGNRLKELPAALSACHRLELLRISANRFEAPPAWLASMPRLSWLACGGNAFDAAGLPAGAAGDVPAIDWQDLQLGPKLGEGASGTIHQATLLRRPDAATGKQQHRQVAVKLFKGTVTSDGWPRSEMTACVAAGPHPNLVSVEARLAGHPEGTDGLVMALVDPAFRNLAGPPSLASCTRDIYASEARWPLATALRIATGIASAMAQLHARGLLHGDLYAHNILWNEENGECLLGDFGAAWSIGTLDAAQVRALQAPDVRAFGCLLGELLERCADVGEARNAAPMPALLALQARCLHCLQPVGPARPAFSELLPALQAIARNAAR